MTTSRVCVVGSINLDTVFVVRELPRPGETVLASTLTASPGGKGANQAIAAARAGAQVQFVGAVGDDDAGRRLRENLNANGVGVDGLATVPGPSGSAFIAVDSAGENSIVVAPAANTEVSLDSAAVRAAIAECDVLLTQLEIPVATAASAAEAARAAGAVVMVNASPTGADPAELGDLAASTDVIVVNETEAEYWTWPVDHQVITLGARGARHIDATGTTDVPTPSVKPVDTTGAGDVFAGALAAGWATGYWEAMRRANAAGALATLTPGAGDCAPTAATVDDIIARG